jgi:dUTP pyrophosphatase
MVQKSKYPEEPRYEKETMPVAKTPQIKLKRVRQNAILPTYGTDGAACFDLYAAEYKSLRPGDTFVIGTGWAFEVPSGYVMRVYPRSGYSVNTKLRLSNCVGTIDSDYRGEVGVILDNISRAQHYEVIEGTRIAQAVIEKLEPRFELVEAGELSSTERGGNGYGSTGA